jgi:glycerol kinase
MWILKNIKEAQAVYKKGNLMFGNTDTWVLWNLTGGPKGGVHITDVTNASRTLFMDLKTLKWDDSILNDFGVDKSILPEIKSSSEVYGYAESDSLLREVPIAGILGDQQAATFGQAAFGKGETKNTYGTGCFLIYNTGKKIVESKNGLLTTVAYKIGDKSPRYALEGSIPVAGSLVQWLRDNLGIIKESSDVRKLVASVKDNGGAYFVPAFSGLFAPRWRMDARGAIVGMTRFINKGHIARAAVESTAFQTKEVFDAILKDTGVDFKELKVDGGATHDDFLMQFQADLLGVPVVRPKVAETTALGAAYAAGLAVGFWTGKKEIKLNWQKDKEWIPKMPSEEKSALLAGWNKAVEKSLNWEE